MGLPARVWVGASLDMNLMERYFEVARERLGVEGGG